MLFIRVLVSGVYEAPRLQWREELGSPSIEAGMESKAVDLLELMIQVCPKFASLHRTVVPLVYGR